MLVFLHVFRLAILCSTAVFLFYAPFLDQLRFSPRKLIAFFIPSFVLFLLTFTALLLVEKIAALIWLIISIPLLCVFVVWSVSEKKQKSIVVMLLVFCYCAFICGCSVFIANLFFDKGLSNSVLYTVAILLLGGATFTFTYNFLLNSILPPLELVGRADLKSIYFTPLFYIVLQIFFFVLYDTMGQMNDLIYLAILVTVNVSTYFLMTDILLVLRGAADKLRMQDELSTAENMLEMQKSQYASWVTQIEAVRRARHDLKHHIALVQTFLDSNDKEGLQLHVREFQRTLPESAPMQLCKHMAVNAILLHYYERAKKDGVALSMLVNIEQDIPFNSQDLSVIFGNCMENAFESCARMNPSAIRTVSLMAKPLGNGLAIIIDNTFEGLIIQGENGFLSSKRDHNRAGVGMASVKLIVKKYDGIVSFETAENIFMTSIRLNGVANEKSNF